MRTTLDLDDGLLDALQARLPDRSKTEAIEHAVEAFLARDAINDLRALAGSVDIEDAAPELRRRDRRA